MKSVQHRIRGFTLIELMTIGAVSSVLVTLTVPAIQDMRQSAQRTVCQNNLKRLALAMHNYHDVYRSFPPAWVLAYRDASSHAAHGWQSSLLPYMDQATLYQKIDRNKAPGPPDKMTSMALEVLQCPSAKSPAQNMLRGGYGNSNYSGNYGASPIPRWTSGRMEAWWPGAVETLRSQDAALIYGDPPRKEEPKTAANGATPSAARRSSFRSRSGSRGGYRSGVFRWNSHVRIRDVIDGTSNTIMAGERSGVSGAGIWIGVQSNRYENDAVTDASFWSPINASLTGYSSQHGDGAYFSLIDGSVRFLNSSVESLPEGGIFQHLADIGDREVIPPGIWSR